MNETHFRDILHGIMHMYYEITKKNVNIHITHASYSMIYTKHITITTRTIELISFVNKTITKYYIQYFEQEIKLHWRTKRNNTQEIRF